MDAHARRARIDDDDGADSGPEPIKRFLFNLAVGIAGGGHFERNVRRPFKKASRVHHSIGPDESGIGCADSVRIAGNYESG